VVFSFGAYTDPALGPAAPALAGRALAEAEGDTAVVVRFAAASPEDLYDATWHVRVLPRHVWAGQPPATWAADTSRARILGSGPFRLSAWDPGQSLRLERVRPAPGGRSGIRVVVWRFAGDQEAAVNLLLAGQADLIETVTSPSARAAAARDSMLLEVPYPSAVYGFVGLRHADASGAPHPVLSSRGVRRALTLAVDRQTLVRTVVGADAAVPPGPVSRALWIWDDSVSRLPFDPGAAAGLLDSLGWTPGPDGVRRRAGSRLAVDILVPGTSPVRRNLAQGIQEMWRRIGVAARVTAVDFPVFQERLAAGRFDAMIGAWLDEPSPRGMAEQWTREGWGGLNAGRYHHPGFDSLVSAAAAVADPGRARRLWREALDTLNADAAGIFLYTPTNVALAARRLAPVPIDPFSWLSGLPGLR
jgi:peptide/nickel transport system substrate-binding protein